MCAALRCPAPPICARPSALAPHPLALPQRETPEEQGLEGAEPGGDPTPAATAAAPLGREAVEPDAIHEPSSSASAPLESDYEEWKRGQVRAELNRTAEALLDIIRSGEELEAAIARHRDEIDDTMLQVRRRRGRQLVVSEGRGWI